MKKSFYKIFSVFILTLFVLPMNSSNAQSSIGKTEKWLNVGSFHNWYSSIGQEREADDPKGPEQLWGWQWPAYYKFQDMQAAKGLWIGTKNYTDPQANNTKFDFKVSHCGPRKQTGGDSEFFPMKFVHIGKFLPTVVRVDGAETNYPGQKIVLDSIDSSMPYDQMLYNYVNTQIGVSMERKIYQFSNPYYDNFHVTEYTFYNTGNLDANDAVDTKEETERKGVDLEDVYFYFQRRHGFIKETRILFGDPTSWGANTLNNEVGPYSAGNDEELRYSYAWHGYWTNNAGTGNNIGGPIWKPDEGFGSRINAADTVGRLGAAQFAGTLTLFAQNGTDPTTDDATQPSTTGYEPSDGELMYSSDTFDGSQMQRRYNLMVKGHPTESHADFITGGDYVNSTAIGGDGSNNGAGYSYVNGYGPYQMAFGDSVKIIIVEGASGLSRDEAIRIGKLFKEGTMSAADKNIAVLGGQDSLHVTFERAMDAYKNGWNNIPEAPFPPKTFEVNSRGGRIDLSWTSNTDGPEVKGFEIYRNTVDEVDGYASNTYFAKYEKIAELGPTETEYADSTQNQDAAYFYYIVSVGEDQPKNDALNIPAYTLTSNRAYAQTYVSAFKRRKGEKNITDKVRVYPNPYIISATNWLFSGGSVEQNKISFDKLSESCTIHIYTELGELIRTIIHDNGSGSDDWDLRTSSNQLVVSGIYIAVVTDSKTGDREIVKFSIIR